MLITLMQLGKAWFAGTSCGPAHHASLPVVAMSSSFPVRQFPPNQLPNQTAVSVSHLLHSQMLLQSLQDRERAVRVRVCVKTESIFNEVAL